MVLPCCPAALPCCPTRTALPYGLAVSRLFPAILAAPWRAVEALTPLFYRVVSTNDGASTAIPVPLAIIHVIARDVNHLTRDAAPTGVTIMCLSPLVSTTHFKLRAARPRGMILSRERHGIFAVSE